MRDSKKYNPFWSIVYGLGVMTIGEPWFPGLTLKKVLNWNFYWNFLKHYYMYSTLFIEITQRVEFVVK
jgi:hypothetical protein